MKFKEPPKLATQLLKSLSCHPDDEALLGDLCERYQARQNNTWFWRQTFIAICNSFVRESWGHRIHSVLALLVGWAALGTIWLTLDRLNAMLSGVLSSYVSDIRQGAVSIYDTGFTVGKEMAEPLEVGINTNGGSIEGTELNAERKPVPRTSVVVVPPANRRSNSALYKIVQSDAQGRFTISGIAPGAWKVFAWESVPANAFLNRDFLQEYEAQGTNVTVLAGTRAGVDISVIRKKTAGQ